MVITGIFTINLWGEELYRIWLGLNSVISEQIEKSHPDFFEWLKDNSSRQTHEARREIR